MNNIRKALAFLMIAAMCLAVPAVLAEEAPEVNWLIDEGDFVIQITVGDDFEGWQAADMSQDDSVVKLYGADVIEGTFVARYQPVGDGDMCVAVRHFDGIACDQAFTWDLHVEDGAVQDVTGSSHKSSPAEEELDPAISGGWYEAETQFTGMTVSKNDGKGWNVEITSPMTHGAYIFRATVYYDCELDSFVYDDGAFWDLPADEPTAENARVTGVTGTLAFREGEEETLVTWYNDQAPDELVTFEPAEP